MDGGAELPGAFLAFTKVTFLCSPRAVLSRRQNPGTRHKKLMTVSDTCDQSASEGKAQALAAGRRRKERAPRAH